MANIDQGHALSDVMDDAALIEAHQTGDPAALGLLMHRHRAGLMGFLAPRVGTEAEDLYQETWSRVARGLPSYSEKGTFKGWLYQIARRLIIDYRRRRGARIKLVLGNDAAVRDRPSSTQPDDQITAQQVARVLEQAMNQMSPEVAEVVRLRLFDGIPFKEIALQQDIPLNTALGRMHRALKRLRKDLIAAELITQGSTP